MHSYEINQPLVKKGFYEEFLLKNVNTHTYSVQKEKKKFNFKRTVRSDPSSCKLAGVTIRAGLARGWELARC